MKEKINYKIKALEKRRIWTLKTQEALDRHFFIHLRGDKMNIERALILLQATQKHFDTNNMITVQRNAHSYLVREGLIKQSDHDDMWYVATDKGLALVDFWLESPMPVATWKIPTK